MCYDFNMLRKSSYVIANFNDSNSIDTEIEIRVAFEMTILIISICPDNELENLHPWLLKLYPM
jgi:hypothetical protein